MDVIVVGAGIAGLRVADLLARDGRSVRVVEARERVGGRLLTVSFEGVRVDLGGQWIGPDHRRARALGRELGLTLVPTAQRGRHTFLDRGQPTRGRFKVPPASASTLLNAVLLLRTLERSAQRIPLERPWLAADAARLDATPFAAWLRENARRDDAAELVGSLLEEGLCASLDAFSALEALHQLRTGGGLRAVERAEEGCFLEGADALATGLAARLPTPPYLGEPALCVEQDDDGARVVTATRRLEAKCVVVALPPQLRARIRFSPPLPPSHAGAGDAIVTGDVIKLVFVYRDRWWHRRGLSGHVVSTSSDGFGVMFDASTASDAAILVVLVTGKRAEALRAIPMRDWKVLAAQRVAEALGDGPEPVAFRAQDWASEEWSLGGYASRRRLGGWTTHHGGESPIGVVHFAGTETAHSWRSYIEGALASAERAASEARSHFVET